MQREKKMPVLFVGHGSPMNAIGDNRARKAWNKEGERLGKPEVIIAVSAHWMTNGLFVRRAEYNPQINDMGGFPQELYEVEYAPPGSIDYADRILELMDGEAQVKNTWGMDHGAWSVLCNMYPEADIPVVMLSTNYLAEPKTLFEIGRKLRPLRDEGALILTSGNVVHNLRMTNWEMTDGYDWADAFDALMREAIVQGKFEIPVNFKDIEGYRLAIPTVEHYYPLLVALGAADSNDKVRVWNDYRELGSMSMTSYTFEP